MYTKKQDCKQIMPVLQLKISFNDQMQMRMAQTTFFFFRTVRKAKREVNSVQCE